MAICPPSSCGYYPPEDPYDQQRRMREQQMRAMGMIETKNYAILEQEMRDKFFRTQAEVAVAAMKAASLDANLDSSDRRRQLVCLLP